MVTQASLKPENSLILILDPTSGDIPLNMDCQLVASTRSCVAVGTMSAPDGETDIVLTDNNEYCCSDSGMQLVFEGFIDTPKKEISVYTVALKPILSLRVPTEHTGIQIWANYRREPNRIGVLVR